jgi:hypothetical protein
VIKMRIDLILMGGAEVIFILLFFLAKRQPFPVTRARIYAVLGFVSSAAGIAVNLAS